MIRVFLVNAYKFGRKITGLVKTLVGLNMEKEPILIENLIRKQLDETCEKIHRIMIMCGTYESDKRRYNQLFREANRILGISKPTFDLHMKHMVKNKLVVRQVSAKQIVFFYLNKNDKRIQNEKEMLENIREEGEQLLKLMKESKYWADLPILLARFDTTCHLKRMKLMLTLIDSKEKFLALASSLWYQDRIQERLFLDLQIAINQIKEASEKAVFQKRLLDSLEKAFKIESQAFYEAVNKLEADISDNDSKDSNFQATY
jgi:DNA-binding HxlR family transcriptional regulator